VDILLDASTSQKTRQELVSCQGYMIAESLSKCGIPCRVMSFCSMTGFTIMRIFRDYEEWRKNEKIFDFVSNGCNRDGLAIRAAHHLINETSYDHKVLIILSDVKPNDVIKIRDREGREVSTYETESGLVDTALEVRRARADGIAVVCVFTGDDEDVPSAKMVYGRDFARIQSLDKFADTVGMLIQNQIKIM
jgi:nitric oxide reductase activation protein